MSTRDKRVPQDVISAAEVEEYLDHKVKAESLHDKLVTRLQHGAIIGQTSRTELYLSEVTTKEMKWEKIAQRLARKIYPSASAVGRYFHYLRTRAKELKYTQLRSRPNALYICDDRHEKASAAIGD